MAELPENEPRSLADFAQNPKPGIVGTCDVGHADMRNGHFGEFVCVSCRAVVAALTAAQA